jgi:hypothetical protein
MPYTRAVRKGIPLRARADDRPERRLGPRTLTIEALECRQFLAAVAITGGTAATLTTNSPTSAVSAPLQAFPLIGYRSSTAGGDAATLSDSPAASPAIASPPPAPGLPYLNDEDPQAPPPPTPGAAPIQAELFPRVTMTQGAVSNLEVTSKYSVLAYDGARIQNAAAMKQDFPQTTVLRYFLPLSYQLAATDAGNGVPFTSTGPATNGSGQVYAGAWLYLAGTTTTKSISATDLTLGVNDASRIQAGQYVVIYDGPAGSFANAEHDRVASVDVATNTITLAARGYKSVALPHLAGAIVAEHDLGSGGNGVAVPPENWAYNLSSAAPLDASGRQFNAVQAQWLASHLNVNVNGNPVGNFAFDGVIFDGELGDFLANLSDDVNNDLTPDSGISATGTNWYGTGLDTFYADVRSLLGPGELLVGGSGGVRGFASLNGVQGEGYPNNNTSFVSPPTYTLFDQKLADYTYHVHQGLIGPQYNETTNKTPTLVYPVLQNGGTKPTSNAPFRLSFGESLLEDGSYGQDRNGIDAWWDEYSVDVVPGSLTFGRAIPDNPGNEAKVRAHEGWLGNPLGPRERLYDPTVFAATSTLIADGDFENGITGWTGSNVALSQDTSPADVFAGSAVLHISPQVAYSSDVTGAAASSPLISLQAGATYTVAFAAMSPTVRNVYVALGTIAAQNVLVSNEWQRHVLTYTASKTGSFPLSFLVGQENGDVYVDEVYVFKGDADVFQRDFDNGTIFVNATPASVTIQLSAVYQRIKGTQDPINNGAIVSGSITIAAFDSAILIRVGASSVTPDAPGSVTATAISSSQVNLSWLDLSSNESGFIVERKLAAGGAYAPVATLVAGIVGYSDSGLTAGTKYSYQVLATNSVGNSAASNIAVATTATRAVPAAPAFLVATLNASNPNPVALSWTNQANNQTGFLIERSVTTDLAFTTIAQVNRNYLAYNDNTVLPGMTYFYRLQAFNKTGNSTFSSETHITTLGGHFVAVTAALTPGTLPSASDSSTPPIHVLQSQGIHRDNGPPAAPPLATHPLELARHARLSPDLR